jgi:hypothetical protein
MPQFLLDAVTDHAARLKLIKNAVLCRTPRGRLLRRDYYNREIWKPAIAATGLPGDTTCHDLRHVCQHALAEGVPISEVSRRLGHKSITTTVDLYGHLVPEASGRARDALDNAFRSARVCPQSARRYMILPKRRSAAGAAGELACRPGSVHPLARAGGHPSRAAVAGSLMRSTRELGRAALSRSRGEASRRTPPVS